jgi:DNA-binding FadR family transcriptional regulator
LARIKRLLKRREMAALWLLGSSASGPMNLGDAMDLLCREMCVSRKTARAVIKALARLGLASVSVVGGEVKVKAVDPSYYVREVALSYIEARKGRCRR